MKIEFQDLIRTIALITLAFALIMLLVFLRGGSALAMDPPVAFGVAAFLVCAGLFDLIWLNSKRNRDSEKQKIAQNLNQTHLASGRFVIKSVTVGSIAIFTVVAIYNIMKILMR